MMQLAPFMVRKSPAIPETDFSGVIVAVGGKVPAPSSEAGVLHPDRSFVPGTAVFGSVPVETHLKGGIGALAEYVAVEMSAVAHKPSNVTFEEASCLAVSGVTAMTLVEAAKLEPDQKVLFNAPCGGVGHFACQLARQAMGNSGQLFGICSSKNFQTAKSLGCDETIDYKDSPDGSTLISQLSARFGSPDHFDKVIDAHGSQILWNSSPSFLKPGAAHSFTTVGPAFASYTVWGMLGAVGKMISNSLIPVWAGGVPRKHQQITAFVDEAKLQALKHLVEDGKLKVEVGEVWKMEDAPKVSYSST
jgi:NADPH:quinone reductase-like Zn-dependent oxidoreductase